MTPASEHLRSQEIDAFVDRELTAGQALTIEQHLRECHACSLRVLSATEMKRAVAGAGRSFSPSPAALARLTAHVQTGVPPKQQSRRRLFTFPNAAWSAIAACLLLAVILSAVQLRRSRDTLSAELLDQHLGTLSAAAAPQVVSTDRHTVKPWFQGKLPFSFNLPDAADLPPDTTLRGADLVYLENRPVALLLLTIGKHQVSIFVTERNDVPGLPALSGRSGFNIRSATSRHLKLIAISDVNSDELERLVSIFARHQSD